MSRIKILMMVVSGLFMMIGIITMISAGAAVSLNDDSVLRSLSILPSKIPIV